MSDTLLLLAELERLAQSHCSAVTGQVFWIARQAGAFMLL